MTEQDIVYRLRKRAEIRRQIPGRKSVEEGTPDRIADLLEEAASEIEFCRNSAKQCITIITDSFSESDDCYDEYEYGYDAGLRSAISTIEQIFDINQPPEDNNE